MNTGLGIFAEFGVRNLAGKDQGAFGNGDKCLQMWKFLKRWEY